MSDNDPVGALAAVAADKGEEKEKPASGKRAAPRRGTKAAQVADIRKGLTQLFTLSAAAAQMFHKDECPQDFANGAPAMADAWATLAERNKGVRDALSTLLTASDWGGVIMATGATLLPVLRRHDVIPSGFAMPQEEPETPAEGLPEVEETEPDEGQNVRGDTAPRAVLDGEPAFTLE
jgi:hypothetical protein